MLHGQKEQYPVKISHPLIRDAYITKERRLNHRAQDVLVIEARNDNKDMEFGGFDNYIYDLVSDLQSVKEQAEQQGGHIDRVDICTHPRH